MMATDQSASALPASDVPAVPPVVTDDTAVPRFSADQVERALFEIQSEQRLLLGATAGILAGAIGAVLWAVITVVTGFQIGWMAVGIGCLVGAAVRWSGRGTTSVYGVVGGTIALLSVVVGNFLSALGLVASAMEIPYGEMAAQISPADTFAIMAATFSPIDLLFYGFAVWEGYRFSIREVTPDEITERLESQGVTPHVVR